MAFSESPAPGADAHWVKPTYEPPKVPILPLDQLCAEDPTAGVVAVAGFVDEGDPCAAQRAAAAAILPDDDVAAHGEEMAPAALRGPFPIGRSGQEDGEASWRLRQEDVRRQLHAVAHGDLHVGPGFHLVRGLPGGCRGRKQVPQNQRTGRRQRGASSFCSSLRLSLGICETYPFFSGRRGGYGPLYRHGRSGRYARPCRPGDNLPVFAARRSPSLRTRRPFVRAKRLAGVWQCFREAGQSNCHPERSEGSRSLGGTT